MRFIQVASLLSLALLASGQTAGKDFATANQLIQELTQLPKCALTCVTAALPASSCELTDFPCLCSDEAYTATTGACILSTCTNKGAISTQGWQMKACQAPVRDAGPMSRHINLALLVIATVCILIRFIARWRIRGSVLGWDDWTILGSYILLLPSTAILQTMTFTGLGQDIWTVPFDDITMMFKYFYIDQYIYQVIIVLTKISIILLYLRIFPKTVSPRFSYVSWVVIAALLAYCVGFLVYSGFQCAPISYFWTQWDGEHEGYCNNFQLAVFFDLTVCFLPIHKLIAIQVQDKQRKIGVVLTFLVGLFVTACSMVRLKYLSHIEETVNPTYDYTEITLWSGIECEVGVICACMPTIMGPLLYFFREHFGTKLSSLSKSGASRFTGNASRIESDEGVKRLPSTASEPEWELHDREQVPKHGGIERVTETQIHRTSHEQLSDDDVKLINQGGYRHDGRDQWDV
ncbi:hypothetical protein Q7P35_012606 [Cladosporium inversicolor]